MKKNKNGLRPLRITVFLVLLLYALFYAVLPSAAYRKAQDLISQSRYDEAYAVLEKVCTGRTGADAMVKASLLERSYALCLEGEYDRAFELLPDMPEYDVVKTGLMKLKTETGLYLGSYEQDNDPFNGTEPIEWIILKEEDGKALVIARYALDCQPYNTQDVPVTWETCDLRRWLNGDFFNAVFDERERDRILPSESGDTVFLLTQDDVLELNVPVCYPTAYAVKQGAYPIYGGSCRWWLGSGSIPIRGGRPEAHESALCAEDGTAFSYWRIDDVIIGVRPAMWVIL